MKEGKHHDGSVVGARGALPGSPFDDDLHKGHAGGGHHPTPHDKGPAKIYEGHEGHHKKGRKE